jgi:hypothetical protein
LRSVGAAPAKSAAIANTTATAGLSVTCQATTPAAANRPQARSKAVTLPHERCRTTEVVKMVTGPRARTSVIQAAASRSSGTCAANATSGASPQHSQVTGFGWARPRTTDRV